MNIHNFIFKKNKITIILLLFSSSYFWFNLNQSITVAQTENSNPLENTEADPLIPPKEIDRPLTSLEKRLIQEKIIILNEQAQLELAAGNQDKAFSLWYKKLKLQRALGTTEEINALGRVGEIAWQQNFTEELNIINDRLLTIQQKLTTENKLNSQLLSYLGQAYQQVRSLDRAINIYQQILQENSQANNSLEEQKNLETLGKLYLAKFDYTQAANIYENLLKFVQTQQPENSLSSADYIYKSQTESNSLQEKTYLIQLAEIYDKLSQPEKAIDIKQKLLKKHQAEQNNEQLAALYISLATNYQTLKQPEQAQKYYEEAFKQAWSLQHLAIAEESLERLALLYQKYQQPLAALKIYQELIKVQQTAYSYYNLMNTYEQIGEIHQQLSNHGEALNAYQKGLELAQSFNYRINYFQDKIEEIKNSKVAY